MKNIKLVILFAILILAQIFFLALSNNKKSIGYESKKAFEEIETERPGAVETIQKSSDKKLEDELITEIAKKIYIEEANRRLIDSKIRDYMFSLNSEDRKNLIQEQYLKIKNLKISSPNSYKIIELEHEIEIMKKGYNPINFIMEKVLNLNSYEFLKNQMNYFFLFLTTFLFLGLLLAKFIKPKSNIES